MNEDVVFIDKKWRSPSSPPKGAIKMSDYFTPERSASAGDAVSCGVCFTLCSFADRSWSGGANLTNLTAGLMMINWVRNRLRLGENGIDRWTNLAELLGLAHFPVMEFGY